MNSDRTLTHEESCSRRWTISFIFIVNFLGKSFGWNKRNWSFSILTYTHAVVCGYIRRHYFVKTAEFCTKAPLWSHLFLEKFTRTKKTTNNELGLFGKPFATQKEAHENKEETAAAMTYACGVRRALAWVGEFSCILEEGGQNHQEYYIVGVFLRTDGDI